MPGLLHSLFPCFGGGGEEQLQQQHHHQHSADHNLPSPPPKRMPESPRSTASTYATPVPVSEAPGPHKSPIYRPADTDKKLPPKPAVDSNAIELPGSAPDLHEMPSPYVPGSPSWARPSHPASSDLPRPSQQSEQVPHSPYSTHSTLAPGSTTGSSYQPSGSIRAPSERGDPDEISPAPSHAYPQQSFPRGGKPNMYSNVADALTDRKRMFERLRNANGVDGQDGDGSNGAAPQSATLPHSSGHPQTMGAVTPVEMWAPMHQPAAQPSELDSRQHTRNPSEPKELE